MSKILVIDDERSIRNTFKDIPEYEKYKVCRSPNLEKLGYLFSYGIERGDNLIFKASNTKAIVRGMEIPNNC